MEVFLSPEVAMHWGYWDGWSPWGMGVGMLMMLLFWVAIIAFAVWFARQMLNPRGGNGGGSALDILKQRYARGEIDKAEYDQKKKDLLE